MSELVVQPESERTLALAGLLAELEEVARLSRNGSPAPTVREAIAAFLETLAVGHSRHTVNSYRTALRRFVGWLESEGLPSDSVTTVELPGEALERYTVALNARGTNRNTLFAYCSAVKSFLRFCYARRWGPRGWHYDELCARFHEVAGRLEYRTKRIDRRLPELVQHVATLPLPTKSPGPLGWSGKRGLADRRIIILRDRALLLSYWTTGARREELVSLNRQDVGGGHADQALIVGKGNKERVIFFDETTLEAIRDYLQARADTWQPLFVQHHRGGSAGDGEGRRLSAQGAWLAVKRYAEGLGIRASTHDFRHAKASLMLNRGAQMSEVSAILGHASLSTTSRIYARYDVANLRAAFDRYSVSADEAMGRG